MKNIRKKDRPRAVLRGQTTATVSVVVCEAYDNDDDKNPENHIKIKSATASATHIANTIAIHCGVLLSMFCNIYYAIFQKV